MNVRFLALCYFVVVPFSRGAGEFNLSSYRAVGSPDSALQRCFQDVMKAGGGVVTIPAGDYELKGEEPIALASNTTVLAYGARFHLPKHLGDKARVVAFEGTNVENFSWFGGHFEGFCFDHRRAPNSWEPNVSTRILVLKTDPSGITKHLTFRDISSERIAGSVINVEGASKAKSESEVVTYASDVAIENCSFNDSGKFMWDYGLLWQILVWPEEYDRADVEMASRYFRNDLIHSITAMQSGEDRIFFDNSARLLRVAVQPASATDAARQGVCFFGDQLPENIVRGKRYYVVEAAADYIKVGETVGGEAIRFTGKGGPQAKLIRDLHQAYFGLYAPTGAGPGKGCVDIVAAKKVRVSGSKLSALGDTMHIQKCEDVVFSNNHITGSRMGAFFLAEYCKNATITGNIVDGTNGSRVMSVEKSAENVTIVGNTFRNGGRGTWLNQPKNLIVQGNVFIDNTTKCVPDRWSGRKTFRTGTWESYPEMYVTLHEKAGSYGPLILKDNLFVLGPGCNSEALTLAPNGHHIQVTGNIFQGNHGEIVVDPSCSEVLLKDNVGLSVGYRESAAQNGNW
ncbi:MAG: right-handed parallel beta-helix repeat-containing protein [Verrucomicrobiota bacterium]